MRVLCVSNMYPGPDDPDYGAFVAAMCSALTRLGHEVDRAVITTRATGRLKTPAKYLRLMRDTIMRARRADVIYGHYLFPTGAIAYLAGRLTRTPWVLTAHGGDVRNLTSPSLSRASAPGITNACSVIAVSRYLADELRTSLGSRIPIHVINMGVDLTRFSVHDRASARDRLALPHDVPILLAVGGLNERKNPLRLLQAFEQVRSRYPHARLVYVGDGPLADALQSAVSTRGWDAAVRLTGALPPSEVASWMAACSLLVLPSLVEPLGVVALEALASGRPVVATRIGGTREVIGRAGALVDPYDPGSIAHGVISVLAAPPTPTQCRQAAEAHGVDRQASRIAEILSQCAATHGKR